MSNSSQAKSQRSRGAGSGGAGRLTGEPPPHNMWRCSRVHTIIRILWRHGLYGKY